METEVDNSKQEEKVAKTEAEVEAEVEAEEVMAETLEEKLEKIEPEKVEEDFKSKYYYLAAEMDNMCKRFQREKEGIVKYSNERLITDLLEVFDNFDRTISAISKEDDSKVKNILVGVEMVKNQFASLLARYGLSPVKSQGEMFDPNYHEAVAEREVDGRKEMEIVEEYQRGYLLNGRVIRAAKVVVAK
ncbi:MAG: nucleotide exchange factor GrpE [Oligoflexia bacterium]|nr:nucleotide exchange factor GrpE [Oligoflexia bacterium]MBF0367077.1 nucleotide exchange factor GrpE [Oligoflexia bacterium]